MLIHGTTCNGKIDTKKMVKTYPLKLVDSPRCLFPTSSIPNTSIMAQDMFLNLSYVNSNYGTPPIDHNLQQENDLKYAWNSVILFSHLQNVHTWGDFDYDNSAKGHIAQVMSNKGQEQSRKELLPALISEPLP